MKTEKQKEHIDSSILLLSPFFYPEKISTGKYNSYLAKAIQEKGADVHIICSHPLYPDWKPKKTNLNLPGINIYRGGGRVFYPRSIILRRLILEIWFTIHILINIVKIRNKITILVAVFPPTFYMLLLKLILPKSVTKICIIHDLLGVMATSNQNLIRRVLSKILKKIECKTFQHCNKLICLSTSMRSTLVKDYGVCKEKIVVHYPFTTIKKGTKNRANLKSTFKEAYSHIVYSGALGEKQIPDKILKLFKNICLSNKLVKCHFFSQGPIFEMLKQENLALKNPNILFHDLVDESDLIELYERSTLHILPQASGTGGGAFPSKLPNLIAANVPIFAICDIDCELSDLLQNYKLSKIVDVNNENDWIKQIEIYLDEVKLARDKPSTTMRSLLDKFCIDNLVESILNA